MLRIAQIIADTLSQGEQAELNSLHKGCVGTGVSQETLEKLVQLRLVEARISPDRRAVGYALSELGKLVVGYAHDQRSS